MLKFFSNNVVKLLLPFTKEAAEHLRELDIDIRTLPTDFPNSFKEALRRIEDLINFNRIPNKIDTSLSSPEVLIYAIMRVFIEILNEDLLRNRFAEAYSKRTENLLLKANSPTIKSLATKTFDWELEKEERTSTRTYDWKLKFYNFLEVAPNLMANDWKLINQPVQNGWTFLTREKLIRLLAEKTKQYILSRRIPRSEIPKLPATYKLYLADLNSKMSILRSKFESRRIYNSQIIKDAYPPCIQSTLKKAEKSINLSHVERLFLTFFLLNIGTSVLDVLDVFRNQPDFNEEITRYQVEFAAGKRGGGTIYTSYGCTKIIYFGLCKRDLDPWCKMGKIFEKILKNPLNYYNAKINLLRKEKKDKNTKSEGR